MSEPLTPSKTNADSKEKPKTKEPATWLIGYNLLSGCLWSFVFLNVFATYFVFGDLDSVFRLTHLWTTAIQSLAVVEIYNSATGIVKSPVMTTTMQVLSRLLVVYGVWAVLPDASGNRSVAYLTVHLAWSVTEVVRYYYYASHLISQQTLPNGEKGAPVSPLLLWFRYNAFLVLYPLGISSECYMIYRAIGLALSYNTTGWLAYAIFLSASLVAYLPGSPILFTHMLSQRRKQKKAVATGKKSQ